MSETSIQRSITGRVIIGFTTAFWILTAPWILQAFVPEPYFLRLPHQLRVMSTPNGFGQIEHSLSPFLAIIAVEAAALFSVATLGWHFKSTAVAISYLVAVLTLAGITLWRLSEAFHGMV